MLCESCGLNEASVHYSKIVNGSMEEKHLCQSCASLDLNVNLDLEDPFSMGNLFTSLIDNIMEGQIENIMTDCPTCGLSYYDFKKSGKFGCKDCYKAFEDKLEPLLRGLHGHNVHRGKIPKSSGQRIFLKREEENLRRSLQKAIDQEEFEEAALLRDKIREIRDKVEALRGDLDD